jgi:uncharacterized protein (DUF58 family)
MRRPLPTLRAVGLACLGLVFIVVGRWLGRPEIAGLGAALFAVPVVAWIVANVRASGTGTSGAAPGGPRSAGSATSALREPPRQSVTGAAAVPVPGQELTVRLLSSADVGGEGSIRPARTVRGDSATSYTWTPPTRGSYRLPPWIVTTFDALHLVRSRSELDPGDRIVVGPTPRETSLPGLDELGLQRIRAGGEQLDTTTRPYRVGDPVRRVHWPVSARQGKLMVRPSLQESDGTRLLLVDRNPAHYSGTATVVANADGAALDSTTDFDAVISTAAFCLEALRASPASSSARVAYFPPATTPPMPDDEGLACAVPAPAAGGGSDGAGPASSGPAGDAGHALLLTGMPGPDAAAWPRKLHGPVSVLLHPSTDSQQPSPEATAAWARAGWSWHIVAAEDPA